MANSRTVPVYDNSEVRREWEDNDHQAFLKALQEAQTLLRAEVLFIPKQIANTAEWAIGRAVSEKLGYEAMNPCLGVGGDMSSEYLRLRNGLLAEFNEAAERLESLMRAHISGQE
jgi:hypothetical protein